MKSTTKHPSRVKGAAAMAKSKLQKRSITTKTTKKSKIMKLKQLSIRPFSTGEKPPVRILSAMYEATGAPTEVMHLQESIITNPDGILPNTKVFVKCLASPINPADINLIEGTYGIPSKPPAIAGNEGVFEVITTGPESNLKTGDWVVPVFPGYGTWRSHILGDSIDFLKVPNDITSAVNISTLMVNPCTAWRILEDFVPLAEGDFVVQNGANSSVGRAIIQLSKIMKLNTINIVRERATAEATAALVAELTDLGATHVLTDVQLKDRTFIKDFISKHNIPQQQIAKLGVNCVSGTAIADLSRFVAPAATVVTYGGMSKKPAMIGTGSFIFSDITYKGFWMTRWNQQHGPTDPKRIAMLTKLLVLLQQGNFKQKHDIHRITSSEDLIKAIAVATSSQKEAKVVLDWSAVINDTNKL